MPNRYLLELRNDNEPTRRALLMAVAIHQHLRDLTEDEAGDDPVQDDLIASALDHAANLVNDLKQLLR